MTILQNTDIPVVTLKMPFTICYLLTLMLSLASYVQPHHKKCVSSTYDKNHNLRDTVSPRVTGFLVPEKTVYLENHVL